MSDWTPSSALGELVDLAGFAYDPAKDIIYSKLDATQRNFGYAYAYDAAALGMAADIDCEPIFFNYDNKDWMIELWKGQYGLETGCEIGVYNRLSPPPVYYGILDSTIGNRPIDPNPAHGKYFACADDSDMLQMSFVLNRDGTQLFSRQQKHWWLTGFRWGVFSLPSQLTMDVTITFPAQEMASAFETALVAMGYTPTTSGLTIAFAFTTPKAPQPPRDETILEQVRSADQAIVSTYASLSLPNNDPNQVPSHAVNELAATVGKRTPAFLATILVDALRHAGHTAEAAADFLATELSLGVDAIAGWVTDAGYTLRAWVESVYSLLKETFTMNFSSVVEVVNIPPSQGQPPPLLQLQSKTITYGSWYVPPPPVILPGDTGRFYLKDNFGVHGSEGSVVYSYVDGNGTPRSVTLTFGCPTGFYSNYASAAPAHTYTVYGKSGSETAWASTIPTKGHPLHVAFVWSDGPPPD